MGRSREMSVEDLYQVGEDRKAELVDGRLVVMTPGGGLHGYACGLIYASLLDHARRMKCGIALPDNVGFIVNLPNRRSFSPDVAFWTGGPLTAKFVDGAPNLAVEVRSESDHGSTSDLAVCGETPRLLRRRHAGRVGRGHPAKAGCRCLSFHGSNCADDL